MSRRVFNLERDLRITTWIIDKVRGQETYAQNLYAALCNNDYQPQEVWGILNNIRWNCSWRASASIIAEIRDRESADVWYGSGSGIKHRDLAGFVEESYVTPEVETDLHVIGWQLMTRRFFDYPD
jgi:hypothetical protein